MIINWHVPLCKTCSVMRNNKLLGRASTRSHMLPREFPYRPGNQLRNLAYRSSSTSQRGGRVKLKRREGETNEDSASLGQG